MLALRVPVILFGLCAALMSGSPTAADEPFYKGKRLSLIINFAAGGPISRAGCSQSIWPSTSTAIPASSFRTWMARAA
jgi:hypothetical protein